MRKGDSYSGSTPDHGKNPNFDAVPPDKYHVQRPSPGYEAADLLEREAQSSTPGPHQMPSKASSYLGSSKIVEESAPNTSIQKAMQYQRYNKGPQEPFQSPERIRLEESKSTIPRMSQPTGRFLNIYDQQYSIPQRFETSIDSHSSRNFTERSPILSQVANESYHNPALNRIAFSSQHTAHSIKESEEKTLSSEAITSTLDHLINNILDQDANQSQAPYNMSKGEARYNFSRIYNTISRQMEGVLKFYKSITNITGDMVLYNLERIVRFFILSSVEGVGQPGFDIKLNTDKIHDIIACTLNKCYREREKQGLANLNKPEFIAYIILLNLTSHQEVQQLINIISPDLKAHDYINKAISAFSYYSSKNHINYFKLAREADYLMSCLMFLHFDLMRTNALLSMKNVVGEVEIESMIKILWFHDFEEAVAYLNFRGIKWEATELGSWMVNLDESQINNEPYYYPAPPQNILSKRTMPRKIIVQGNSIIPAAEPKIDLKASFSKDNLFRYQHRSEWYTQQEENEPTELKLKISTRNPRSHESYREESTMPSPGRVSEYPVISATHLNTEGNLLKQSTHLYDPYEDHQDSSLNTLSNSDYSDSQGQQAVYDPRPDYERSGFIEENVQVDSSRVDKRLSTESIHNTFEANLRSDKKVRSEWFSDRTSNLFKDTQGIHDSYRSNIGNQPSSKMFSDSIRLDSWEIKTASESYDIDRMAKHDNAKVQAAIDTYQDLNIENVERCEAKHVKYSTIQPAKLIEGTSIDRPLNVPQPRYEQSAIEQEDLNLSLGKSPDTKIPDSQDSYDNLSKQDLENEYQYSEESKTHSSYSRVDKLSSPLSMRTVKDYSITEYEQSQSSMIYLNKDSPRSIFFYILLEKKNTYSNIVIQACKTINGKCIDQDLRSVTLSIEWASYTKHGMISIYELDLSRDKDAKISLRIYDSKLKQHLVIQNKLEISSATHNFILNLDIHKSFSIMFWKDNRSVSIIENPIEQLIYLALYILDQPNPMDYILDLVSQFTPKIHESDKSRYREHPNSLIRNIFKIISQDTHIRCQDKVCTALIIIGLVKNYYDNPLTGAFYLTSEIIERLVPELNSISNSLYDMLKYPFYIGVAFIMACNKNTLVNLLHSFLESIEEPYVEVIVLKFLSFLSYYDNLATAKSSILVKKLNSCDRLKQSRQVLPIIKRHSPSLVDFIEFLHLCFHSLSEKTFDSEGEVQVILRTEDFNYLKKELTMYTNKPLNLSDIQSILKFIKAKDITFRRILIESNLPYRISNTLTTYLGGRSRYNHCYGHGYSDHYEYNSRDRMLESDLVVFKSIFNEFYDEHLLYHIKPLELAKSLLSSKSLKLSEVLNIFNFKGYYFKEIVECWHKLFTNHNSNINIIFNEIDTQLSLLEDSDDLKYACSLSMSKLYELSNFRQTDLLDHCHLFENSKVEQLRVEYIQICTQNYISNSQNSQYFLNKLLDLSKTYDNSLICHSLLCNALGMFDSRDKAHVTEAEMRNHLYENPSSLYYWNSILTNYYSYQHIVRFEYVIEFIFHFGNEVIEKNITVREAMILKNHTRMQRDTFIFYITKSFEIKAFQAPKPFEDYLNDVIDVLTSKLESKHIIRRFLDKVCYELPDIKLLEQIYEEAMKGYKERSLNDFDISRDLQELWTSASLLHPILESDIFNSILLSVKNSTANLNSESIFNVCSIAEEEYRRRIEGFREGLLQQSLDSANIFKVESVDIEMRIISRLNILDEESMIRCREFLYCYNYKSSLMSYCEIMLKFKDPPLKIGGDILKACSKYLDCMKESIISIDRFMILSRKILTKLGLDLPIDPELTTAFKLLNEYSRSSELINFLSKLKEVEMEYLKDGVFDYDESYVTSQTILDIETIWSFHNEITSEAQSNFFILDLNSIRDKIKLSKYEKILSQLTSCSTHINAIIELHTDLNYKEDAKNNQIREIHRDSCFDIIQNSLQEYDIRLSYAKNTKISLNMTALLDLKDRASLIIYTTDSKQADIDVDSIIQFVEFVSSLNNVMISLNNLCQNGCPIPELPDFSTNTCKLGQFNSVKQLENELSGLYTDWEKILNESYQKFYWLTYLHDKQIWILEKYLSNPEEVSYEAIYLLSFIGRTLPEDIPRLDIDPNSTIHNRLTNLGEYLNRLIEKPKREFIIDYKVPSECKILAKAEEILMVETKKYLNGIISLYLHSDRKFPRPDQIFFCKSNTQFHELSAFMNRYFLSTQNELYVLINGENLSLEIQQKFIALFNQLIDYKHEEVKSQFGLIVSNSKSVIGEHFKYYSDIKVIRIRDYQIIPDSELLKIIRAVDKNSLVVNSESTGLGKSHYIHQQAKIYNKQLISIPLAGDVNLKELYTRMASRNFEENSILYLSLNHTDSSYLINEVIISLTLFRCLYTSYGIICLPDTCSIYIEVANTYQNALFKSLDYLKYLNIYTINCMSLDSLMVNDDIKDPVQVVSSCLRLYDSNSIKSKDIDYSSGKNLTINSISDISSLYTKYFIDKQLSRNQSVTYTQFKIFTRILYNLLKNFSYSSYSVGCIKDQITDLRYAGLSFAIPDYENLRSTIFESLLSTTEEFTTKCINNVRSMQSSAVSAIGQDANDTEIAHSLVSDFECNFSWESSNHFVMIFLTDGSSISIYRNKELVPDNIKKLIFIQGSSKISSNKLASILQRKQYDIEDYSTMNHVDLLKKLQTFCVKKDLVEAYAKCDYVMTPDNFLKMCLIYVRVMAGIPVILMGETGCGKTSLVKFFVNNVLHDTLEVINIHGGISSKFIKDKMQELRERARGLEEGRKIWVFFDEFNTSDCIGIISEIMCEHSLEGEPLPSNIAFLAACNPYRLKLKKLCFQENVGIKKAVPQSSSTSKLMHIVKPLPDSMIEYVWDFGALQENDARKYIETMLEGMNIKYLQLFVNLICSAHRYFHEKEDVSSVSLRDVRRFTILNTWFRSCIGIKDGLQRDDIYTQNLERYALEATDRIKDIELRAGILALTHCYYLRISSQNERNEFLHRICTEAQIQDLDEELILKIIRYEENDYILRMELPDGTALNKALRENVFAIIPCILNKLPIFVCGKPGCSKSLAIQLIFANLRGEKSKDPYFKTLPELCMFSFQGSDSCTSEGIIKVFERALKYSETVQISNKNSLPVVIFDEIGLAEISRHNPLKVLHSLLELENRQVGFVGISNWRLDASKMNRALYLARPDPDNDDLKLTAMNIYNTYSKGSKRHAAIINNLASSYFELKRLYKETTYPDFYGLRDFYHLIKQVSRDLIMHRESDSQNEALIIQRAIHRNFGGLAGAAENMSKIFCKQHDLQDIYSHLPQPNVVDLIRANLEDESARYLMLITKGEIATLVLDKFLDVANRRMLVGSSLENDVNQEDYGFRSLSDVILYAEKGISVIFKDMDHIYSSLYDLFNQSFAQSGDRRYCRIALGALFNPRCFIHKDFHAVVLMSDDDNSITRADAPFLNRFEKHVFNLDTILDKKHNSIIDKLTSWISMIMTPSTPQDKILLAPNIICPIYSKESLQLLVLYILSDEQTEEEILRRCKEFLLRFTSADLLVLSRISALDPEEAQLTCDSWRDIHNITFRDFLTSLIRDPNEGLRDLNKIFAYTYDKEIQGSILEAKYDEVIVRKNFSSFKSEQDIRKDMLKFLMSESVQIYLLEIDYARESNHLSILKFLVDKLETETKQKWECQKSIVVVVHMMRNITYQSVQNLFEGWDYWMFNEITQNRLEYTDDFINSSTEHLICEEKLKATEYFIENLTEKCMLKLKYEPKINSEHIESLNDHIFNVISRINQDADIKLAFKNKILKILKDRGINMKDWKKQIFCNPEIILNSSDLYGSILLSIEHQIESAYTVILYLLESSGTLNSYFTLYGSPLDSIIQQIWRLAFENMSTQNIRMQSLHQSNLIRLSLDCQFPFIKQEYSLLRTLIGVYLQNLNNEDLRDSARSIFEASFVEKTLLRKNLQEVFDTPEISELYYRDLIKIMLSENLISLEHEDFAYLLLNSVGLKLSDLIARLILLFENENKLIVSIALIDTFNQFTDDNAKVRLQQVIEDLNSVDNEIEENKEHQSESEESASKADLRNEWEKLGTILETMISMTLPTNESLDRVGGLSNYLAFLDKIFNLLIVLEGQESVPIRNIETINFWVNYTSLITKLKLPEEYLIEAAAIQDEDWGESVIFSDAFSEYIFGKISILPNFDTNQDLLMFACGYLSILVPQVPEMIIKAAELYERTEIWKYSTRLIDSIFTSTQLDEGIITLKDLISSTEEPVEFFLPENIHMIAFENALNNVGIESKFGVIISDRLHKFIVMSDFEASDEDEYTKHALVQNHKCFEFFSDAIIAEDDKLKSIKRCICLFFLRRLFDIFCSIHVHQLELNREEQAVLDDMSRYLTHGAHANILRIYCIKKMNQIRGSSLKDTLEFLSAKADTTWAEKFSDIYNGEVRIYPMKLELLDRYLQLNKKIAQLFANQLRTDVLDDIVTSTNSADDRLVLGLGFQNVIFSRYADQTVISPNITRWYEAKKTMLEDNLGRDFTTLISCFIYNFPNNSILKLTPGNLKDYEYIQTICFTLNIILSHNHTVSPMTSIFFDENGNIQPNFIERFNNMFIFAAESSPLIEGLNFTLNHFDSLKSKSWHKSYSKGGWYKCSSYCEFIYFIDNCGGAVMTSTCPECKATIGGSGHKFVEREGHVNMSDDEARAYLKDRIQRCELESTSGYRTFSDDTPFLRKLIPISYKLLHFILNSVLYFLKVSNILSLEDIKQILTLPSDNYERVLSKSMMKDLDYIFNSLDVDESYIWTYHVISKLSNFLTQIPIKPTSFKVRNDFEMQLQDEIILPNLENRTDIIQEYKKTLININASKKSMISVIEELECPTSIEYKYITNFRCIREPTLENMINVFKLSPIRNEYKVLDIYLSNYDSFKQLKSFYPIIEFTNYLLVKYDHKITRQEARETSMSVLSQEDPELNKLFERFLEAWENASFTELDYTCKVLPRVNFTENHDLIFFLPDDREPGSGMYMSAALTYLSRIQNNLLHQIYSAISISKNLDPKYILDEIQYPIQYIKSNNVLSSRISEQAYLETCSLNYTEYGKGKDVVYDFDRLQDNLIKDLLNAKVLDTEKLDFIQYQFELMNSKSTHSGIISEIRTLIPQFELNRESENNMSIFLDNLAKTNKSNFSIVLKDIYSSINILLCYLKNNKNSQEYTISSFSKKISSSKICSYLIEENSISKLKLCYCIAVYEAIEEKYFPNILKFIRDEYRKQDRQEEIQAKVHNLIQQISEGAIFPKVESIQRAIMRFISRYLLDDLDGRIPIKTYISNQDFWNVTVSTDQIDNLMEIFPNDVLVEDSVAFYTAIRDLSTPKPREIRHTERTNNNLKPSAKSSIRKAKGIR